MTANPSVKRSANGGPPGPGRWYAVGARLPRTLGVSMVTVLTILGAIFALITVPIATILGLIGFWIFGFWSAFIGVLVGLGLQFGDS